MTANGRPFRPSDWSERLCGLTAALGPDKRLQYSPWLRPIVAGDIRAVIVGRQLAELEPRLHQFLLGFARDNELQIAWVPGALTSPQGLVPPPSKPPSAEPREPV